jgi:hypothetical protein
VAWRVSTSLRLAAVTACHVCGVRAVRYVAQSTVIAMAFLHRHVSVDQTIEACRVEEEFQV